MSTTKLAPERPHLRKKFESRRKNVVSIAAREFAYRGYHDTSIDDLVVATGLQRGGLYHYISSKRELLLLIHDQLMEPLLREAKQMTRSEAGPTSQLKSLVHLWVAHVVAHRDHLTVFNEERRIIESDPDWQRVRRSRREFQGLITTILERGVDAGEFAIEDIDVAVMVILGIVNHIVQWFDPRGRLQPSEIAEHSLALILRGIAGADGQ